MSETASSEGSPVEASEAQAPAKVRRRRKVQSGVVISDKMNQCITVVVDRRVKHRLYDKYIRRSTKLHAHDENNEAHVGDRVDIAGTRPLSKLKRFRLLRVTSQASGPTGNKS